MALTDAPTIDQPAYFDRLAEVERDHWWSRGMWALASYWLDGALTGRTGLTALDVGCGTGQTALRLARRPEIARVIGLDLSPDALAHARRRHPFPLARGSATALPVEARSCDVVTCFDVLQHLPTRGDRRAAFEMFRVLAPGGVAVVRANGRGWSGDASVYTLRTLVDAISSAGLRVRRASYANCLPSLLQEVRGRLVPKGRGGPAHPSNGGLRIRPKGAAVDRIMGAVSASEAFLAGVVGVRLPFGHSTLLLVDRPA